MQSQTSGIFSQPLATFGNGLSFSGVSLDHITTALSLNESWARSLSRVTLRASQGNEATLHLGERYPILNASYAPVFNSSAISAVLGNQSYVPPFPSVSYEDLGLSLKAKPTIHGSGDVSVALELQVRSLTGQSSNGVPVIANQEYKGGIRLNDGETAVVAGEITTNDQLSMAGIPGTCRHSRLKPSRQRQHPDERGRRIADSDHAPRAGKSTPGHGRDLDERKVKSERRDLGRQTSDLGLPVVRIGSSTGIRA